MSGLEVVAGVVALFFACGIVTGVLGVMALSAMRDHRGRAAPRRHAQDRADTLEWTWPRRPSGPDWEDRPGWHDWREQLGPDDGDDKPPPPWPGRRG